MNSIIGAERDDFTESFYFTTIIVIYLVAVV